MGLLEFYIEKFWKSFQLLLALAKTYRTEILIGLFTALLVKLILNWARNRKRNFPPGPRGLPIVGYLPFLPKHSHLHFIELGKIYGGVFSVRLGSKELVVLNDVEAIKEGLTNPDIQGRPSTSNLSLILRDSAFFVRDNHVWREQRKFVVQSMKDLGLGKSKIENEIQDEIAALLNVLSSAKGQPLDLKLPLSPSMSNNICSLVFGKRYEFNDPVRKTLDTALETATRSITLTAATAFFPWLLSVPFLGKILAKSMEICKQNMKIVEDICNQEIEKHREKFDPRNVADFIDSYLLEMQSRKEKNYPSTFDERTLKANVLDIFSAGSETVRTSILWCINVVSAYPDVQKKVQKEIQEIIGSERSPEYLDQKEMPYTHATILETMRWRTIVPLNVIRCVTEDTKVGGYDIPKGTSVLSNLWNVHHDPNLWDEPDSFKPERFLSSDGKTLLKSSNLMPFSLGKRSCPGETMANMEVFLYFASILQKFDVFPPEGEKPDLEGNLFVVYCTKPYKARFIARGGTS